MSSCDLNKSKSHDKTLSPVSDGIRCDDLSPDVLDDDFAVNVTVFMRQKS